MNLRSCNTNANFTSIISYTNNKGAHIGTTCEVAPFAAGKGDHCLLEVFIHNVEGVAFWQIF